MKAQIARSPAPHQSSDAAGRGVGAWVCTLLTNSQVILLVHDQTLKTIVLQAQHLPKPTGMKIETLKREEKGRWKSFLRVPHLSFVPVSTAGGNLALAALPLPPLPELPPKILPLNQAYPGRLPELKHDSLTPSACSPRADARGHLCRFQEIMHSLWRK